MGARRRTVAAEAAAAAFFFFFSFLLPWGDTEARGVGGVARAKAQKPRHFWLRGRSHFYPRRAFLFFFSHRESGTFHECNIARALRVLLATP